MQAVMSAALGNWERTTLAAAVTQACNKSIECVQEASSVRSALATALAASGASWPAFMPVHDPTRDAWRGITARPGLTCLHDTDSVRIRRLPQRLCQVTQQC